MATVRRSVPMKDQHQVFRGVFEDWQARAGVRSALPDAPVVPDARDEDGTRGRGMKRGRR